MYDKETGLGYYKARYYDPVAGRFLTEDSSREGSNWTLYVGNNPINNTDPTGLSALNPFSSFGSSYSNYGLSSFDISPSPAAMLGNINQLLNPTPMASNLFGSNYSNTGWGSTDLVAANTWANLKAYDTQRSSLDAVQMNYFGGISGSSAEASIAAKAARNVAYDQYLRTEAGPWSTGFGETLRSIETWGGGLLSSVAYPFNYIDDTIPILVTGNARDRHASQSLDIGNGDNYLQNVGHVGWEYTKGVFQVNKVQAAYTYATDDDPAHWQANGRNLQVQAIDAGVQWSAPKFYTTCYESTGWVKPLHGWSGEVA